MVCNLLEALSFDLRHSYSETFTWNVDKASCAHSTIMTDLVTYPETKHKIIFCILWQPKRGMKNRQTTVCWHFYWKKRLNDKWKGKKQTLHRTGFILQLKCILETFLGCTLISWVYNLHSISPERRTHLGEIAILHQRVFWRQWIQHRSHV